MSVVGVGLQSDDTHGEQRMDRSVTKFGDMSGGSVNMGGNPVTNLAIIITVGSVLIFGLTVYIKKRRMK